MNASGADAPRDEGAGPSGLQRGPQRTAVRPATEADVETLVLLGALFHAESPAHRCDDWNPEMVARAALAAVAEGRAWVAEDATGAIVGMIAGDVYGNYYGSTTIADILAWYVVPAARGQAGLALLGAWEAWARGAADRVDVTLSSGIDHERAWALLEHRGWTLIGGTSRFTR